MATLLDSFWILPSNRDKEGYRTYKLRRRVKDAVGPADAMATPGLPQMGDPWDFNGDSDDWAFCGYEIEVKPVVENELTYWDLTFTFGKDSCKDYKTNPSEDPVLDPQKISGHFKTCQEEATVDRFGKKILSSSYEILRGKHVEFDKNKPTVKIEQNVLSLQLPLCSSMMNRVNGAFLWGLRPRTIKMSNFSWERKFYAQCHEYYTRSFEFELDYATWDRDVLDEGYKVLKGHWNRASNLWILDQIAGHDPDPVNPQHFMRYKDRNNENCKVVLDGAGSPFIPDYTSDDVGTAEYYWGFYNDTTYTCDAMLCSEAVQRCFTDGYILKGPYTTQGQCQGDITSLTADESAWNNNLALDGCESIPGVSIGKKEPGKIHIEKYDEVDFLQLGIPISL